MEMFSTVSTLAQVNIVLGPYFKDIDYALKDVLRLTTLFDCPRLAIPTF